MSIAELDLQSFYPPELKVLGVTDLDDLIVIHMHSMSNEATCHKCGAPLIKHHGTHRRRVQDLPILGKNVMLDMQICDYQCTSDSFAFKKRQTYGTIIVDEAAHNPVAVLDGRDGKALKEWLRKNKHVTTVTRDRASAYAKAVEEVLPDCMQIADRFQIHQNLLDAVNKVLGRTIPAVNPVPVENSEKTDSPESATSSLPSDDGEKKSILRGKN